MHGEREEGQYEWLGVQMDGFALYNIHRRPSGDEGLYTLEVQELMGEYNRAIIVGDHNIHLGDYNVEGKRTGGMPRQPGAPDTVPATMKTGAWTTR